MELVGENAKNVSVPPIIRHSRVYIYTKLEDFCNVKH